MVLGVDLPMRVDPMNILSNVSETSLITLKARAEEVSNPDPLLRD